MTLQVYANIPKGGSTPQHTQGTYWAHGHSLENAIFSEDKRELHCMLVTCGEKGPGNEVSTMLLARVSFILQKSGSSVKLLER